MAATNRAAESREAIIFLCVLRRSVLLNQSLVVTAPLSLATTRRRIRAVASNQSPFSDDLFQRLQSRHSNMRMLARITGLLWLVLLPLMATGQGTVAPTFAAPESSSINSLLTRAQSSLQSGDLIAAGAALQSVLTLEAGNKPARRTLIQLLLRQGLLAEAATHAQTLARLYPDDTETIFLRALVAFQSGQLSEAAALAERCLQRDAQLAEGHKLLALAAYLQRQLDKFESHIKTAAKLNPADPEPSYHLGRYYFEDKRYEEALGAFKRVGQLQPDHFKAHYYAGLVYESQNETAAAKQEFQAAINIIERTQARYAWPYADLGQLLCKEGEEERGLNWLYRAVRHDPTSPYAHYHYAKALFRKEATHEVKQELLAAIRLDPGYADAHYLLARYYQKTGAAQLAKEAFARFEEIKKNPAPSPYGVRRW
jgi:tetratricopeptide (TPR) repeat protein